MKMDSLQSIMRDFKPSETAAKNEKKAPLTIWLAADDKARYDRLQKQSGRKFGKKIREVILAVLDHVDESA